MLATDRFLLISIGRTGTGALHRWLQQVLGLRIISNLPHEPYRTMAAKCKALGLEIPPAWTIIRNPWDYYVDKYFWEQTRGPCFKGTFREFLGLTREQPTVQGYFYSLTQKWDDLGADKCAYLARFENYDEDVVHILYTLIPDLLSKEQIRKRLQENRGYGESLNEKGQPQWRDRRDGYTRYYDEETRRWVYELDKGLIKRFGYEFLER